MNIIKKIEEEKCSIDELKSFLDDRNPIVLYHTMTYIGKKGYKTADIEEKLYKLSLKRESEDKLLGIYKISDLAIATMIKLWEKEEDIEEYKHINEFEKGTVKRVFNEIEW
ncbi:hypothetical protein [Bacillus swezeyi]|uniref:hypothetical protein n=1 Tax=Bacillus swezeyi TaxID=1925020 RepID=UPI00123B8F00|nr:hypothetical protein [Bacillus swezeyi]KAA6475395.1 hypothetical protein DX928_15585 [Bacillus swezeyi]